ncbi:MAG: recombinase family protein [Clostridia bacterium]|nr:recombinase family protein [Clostridia bacterium]
MRAAIYCRLSREDEDKHGQDESESIQNQKSMLIRYATERGWEIYDIYCDENYSGTDSDRPAFNRMIADAEKKRFDIVLVKTLSRFSRLTEVTEKYIEGKFIEWGIRFRSAVDYADSENKGNKKARQVVSMTNQWYVEDLSENVRTVFNNKRRSGQFIGSFACYGYSKSENDKGRLVVDEDAAEVVREIFRLYLAGSGKQHIARLLNERGIPNPTKYKQLAGCGYANGALVNGYGLWNKTTVGRILHNEMYTGTMVQGVKRKVSYKSAKMIGVPPEKWIRVEGTHEPVIDRETFDLAQEMLREKARSDGAGQVHALAGKVRCLDCGSIMVKSSFQYKGVTRRYLSCKLYAGGKGMGLCTRHSIRLDLLEAEVAQRAAENIARYYDPERPAPFSLQGENDKRLARIHKDISLLSAQIDRREKAIASLYLDRAGGAVSEEQFARLSRAFEAEKQQLQSRIGQLTDEENDIRSRGEEQKDLSEQLRGLLTAEPLARELVSLLIDSVEVGEKDPDTGEQPIRINWLI